MKEADHSYKGPTTSREIPDGVARYLDGPDLLTKKQALRLSTVDPDGWPHAALLSAGDMVMISVQDNGVGLSKKVIAHLFEPFFTTKEAGSGLGLGLAISTGIINQFGGTLTASGEEQCGAVFLIKLPVYRNEIDVRDV